MANRLQRPMTASAPVPAAAAKVIRKPRMTASEFTSGPC